jgi:hypothetical protein
MGNKLVSVRSGGLSGLASHIDFSNGCFPIETLKRDRERERVKNKTVSLDRDKVRARGNGHTSSSSSSPMIW